MTSANYHLGAIPDGFQIFEERLEVAGISHRKADAVAFVRRGKDIWLELSPEPNNPYDRNAIRVIGCAKGFFGTKRYFIGYVPAKVASAIVHHDYVRKIQPRLLKTWIGDTGYVEVLFQILGPKGERYAYQQADPISLPPSQLGQEHHYTEYVVQVKYLKELGRDDEAIDLLTKLVAETEKEAARKGWGVAPWYYEQLAILYRKGKRFADEVAILERYERQPKAPGVGPEKLANRLNKARARHSSV